MTRGVGIWGSLPERPRVGIPQWTDVCCDRRGPLELRRVARQRLCFRRGNSPTCQLGFSVAPARPPYQRAPKRWWGHALQKATVPRSSRDDAVSSAPPPAPPSLLYRSVDSGERQTDRRSSPLTRTMPTRASQVTYW